MKKMHRPSNLYILVHITEANHFFRGGEPTIFVLLERVICGGIE